MKDVYGVLINGIHHDISNTERGAKCYATRNQHLSVSIRYNGSCIVREIAHKYEGVWKDVRYSPPFFDFRAKNL